MIVNAFSTVSETVDTSATPRGRNFCFVFCFSDRCIDRLLEQALIFILLFLGVAVNLTHFVKTLLTETVDQKEVAQCSIL